MADTRGKGPRAVDPAREQEAMGTWFRAGNNPGKEPQPQAGEPPFPCPTIDDILKMPHDDDASLERQHEAALAWVRQFAARVRWKLEMRDLRTVSHTNSKIAAEIDKARRILSVAEIELALAAPKE